MSIALMDEQLISVFSLPDDEDDKRWGYSGGSFMRTVRNRGSEMGAFKSG